MYWIALNILGVPNKVKYCFNVTYQFHQTLVKYA